MIYVIFVLMALIGLYGQFVRIGFIDIPNTTFFMGLVAGDYGGVQELERRPAHARRRKQQQTG
jgi:hypothetical protein